MKHQNLPWEIRELIEKKKEVNPRPQFQRTAVWTTERKALLIDSILSGYDLPKFYVKRYSVGSSEFAFEVADGQQRMRAIWDYFEGKFTLQKNTVIAGVDLSGLSFDTLPNEFKNAFLDYTLAFTEIYDANPGEINELFKRLQRGVILNPPELRHAMYSEIGFYINSFLDRNVIKSFFEQSRIVDNRFKYQDYVDHVIALIHYENKRDLKANLMSQLYIDFQDAAISDFKEYFVKAEKVFLALERINSFKNGLFKNKWAFVDYFWLLHNQFESIDHINYADFARLATEFEAERVKFNPKPEKLLKLRRVKFGEVLYNYIQAFNKEGANKENIDIRATVLGEVFKNQFLTLGIG